MEFREPHGLFHFIGIQHYIEEILGSVKVDLVDAVVDELKDSIFGDSTSAPRKRLWRFRLIHMIEVLERVQSYLEGMASQQFRNDQLTIDAVVGNFIKVGEPVRVIPEVVKARYSEVNWDNIRDMGNNLADSYDSIDSDTLWSTIKEDLPIWISHIQRIYDETTD